MKVLAITKYIWILIFKTGCILGENIFENIVKELSQKINNTFKRITVPLNEPLMFTR